VRYVLGALLIALLFGLLAVLVAAVASLPNPHHAPNYSPAPTISVRSV